MEIRKSTINPQLLVALMLVLAGVASRLVPHMPNIAPVGAIALFGGAVLDRRIAIWLPLLAMMLSDMVIGFYPGIIFTWGGFLLVAFYGMLFKKAHFISRILLGAFGSGVIFYLVSNIGVWVFSGMYAHTYGGFIECYSAAIPFFRMSLIGDLVFTASIFGIYESMLRIINHKEPAPRDVAA